MTHKTQITLLGASGSIGRSALRVIERNQDNYELFAVTANTNKKLIKEICLKHHPKYAVFADESVAHEFAQELKPLSVSTQVLAGAESLKQVASAKEVDVVVAGIVGAAGLPSCFAAAQTGKRILLANKESLVIAGRFLLEEVQKSQAELIPLDSEHNAIFQCYPKKTNINANEALNKSIKRIYLTASGGPFLERPLDTFQQITPEEACAHPRWNMGKKISVDSATMMNKGLELIEASLLFGLPGEQIKVVIHPQSIVHSLVEYIDGSVLAQMGNPDMAIPMAHALGYPNRIPSGAEFLDVYRMTNLEFHKPCYARFPALDLAYQAVADGGSLPVVLNAANEICVAQFLDKQLAFTSITQTVKQLMNHFKNERIASLNDVMELDHEVRVATLQALS